MATTIEQAQEALALARTPLRYSVALGENEAVAFWIRDVAGVEELSRPGRFELRFPLDAQTMRGESHEFSPDAVLKSKAVITLERDAGQTMCLCTQLAKGPRFILSANIRPGS